jgi:hypothetical protein
VRRGPHIDASVGHVSAAAPRIATIGVYGFDLDGFLDALRRADVHELIDVRQRRGVRGRDYSWANSERLQAALGECSACRGLGLCTPTTPADLTSMRIPGAVIERVCTPAGEAAAR